MKSSSYDQSSLFYCTIIRTIILTHTDWKRCLCYYLCQKYTKVQGTNYGFWINLCNIKEYYGVVDYTETNSNERLQFPHYLSIKLWITYDEGSPALKSLVVCNCLCPHHLFSYQGKDSIAIVTLIFCVDLISKNIR